MTALGEWQARIITLILAGSGITIAVWASLSAFVVANRLLYEWQARRFRQLAQLIRSRPDAALASSLTGRAVHDVLARLPRRTVYRLIASPGVPPWLAAECAAFSHRVIGDAQIVHDAQSAGWRRRWRRLSAVRALGTLRIAHAHLVLSAAIRDADADVANAAAIALHHLGDRAAAEILIGALRTRSPQPAVIAAKLDQFPLPIAELLLPLMRDDAVHMRYWAAALLARYGNTEGVPLAVAAGVADSHPTVRKAALATLGECADASVLPLVQPRLHDAEFFVRATAVRALAMLAVGSDALARAEIASWVAPALADGHWEVRAAAKDALLELGAVAASAVAAQLDSADAFARDGATEVMAILAVASASQESDAGPGGSA